MPHRNFHNLDTFSIIMAILVGIWGSIISFIRREKRGYKFYRLMVAFLTDLFTNIGFTLLTYIGLIGYGINELLAVAIAGFVGHQGTRLTYLAEIIIAEKLGSKAAIEEIKKGKNGK